MQTVTFGLSMTMHAVLMWTEVQLADGGYKIVAVKAVLAGCRRRLRSQQATSSPTSRTASSPPMLLRWPPFC
jgi:hypothetical protein